MNITTTTATPTTTATTTGCEELTGKKKRDVSGLPQQLGMYVPYNYFNQIFMSSFILSSNET